MRLLIALIGLWISVQCQSDPYDEYFNRMRQYKEQLRMRKEAEKARYCGYIANVHRRRRRQTVDEEKSAAPKDAYDVYFDRMRQYGEELRMRKLAEKAKYCGWMSDSNVKYVEEEKSAAPSDPFGKLPVEKVQPAKTTVRADEVCRKFAPSVHLHCRGSTKDKHAMRCFSYFRDCSSVIPKDDPLSVLATLYSTLPKPDGSTDAAVTSPQPSEGFIPEPTSELTSMSSSTPPPLDPPRAMTEAEKGRVDMACRRVMPTATRNCRGDYSKLQSTCQSYLSSCAHLIPKSNPLHNLAQEAIQMQIIPTDGPIDATTAAATSEWEQDGSQASTSAPSASILSPYPPRSSSIASSETAAPTSSHAQSASTLTAEQIEEMERDARLAKAELPQESLAVLHKTCERFLPTVRKHCVGDFRTSKFARRCQAFYQDCGRFMPQTDPLYEIAHAFDSGVGINIGSWAVAGIPYYPINEEGAIGGGYMMNIPFGSWGGGYSDHIGVRDYWSQYQEIGANWYDGKYGYKSGWSVPLVQSLGIEGESHVAVSVPIKPGDLGKPIGVDVGGGVGPYYQQNQHVGVDWMDGQVNSNFGVGVPIAGVGVNTGVGVSFPGASTWLG